jgi:hypothetical protein
MHIAERQQTGSGAATLIYRHTDQVDSTVFTDQGGVDDSRRYSAYGDKLSGIVYDSIGATYHYGGQMDDGTRQISFYPKYCHIAYQSEVDIKTPDGLTCFLGHANPSGPNGQTISKSYKSHGY